MEDARYVGVKSRSPLEYLRLYASSRRGGREKAPLFAEVAAYCMFIGYPRSGHSLVGSLIDAHRHAVIAHELDALAFVERRFTRLQLFHLILENSREFTQEGREWSGYSYEVPGQWQGRWESIRVLGDKKGGRSVRRLAADRDLLDRLRRAVEVPVRFVHVVRNPFDNIATRQRRKPDERIEDLADLHFALVKHVQRLRERVGEDVLDVRHEDVIADPRAELRRICAFLSLDAPEGYLDAAAGIVHSSPRRSRQEVEWPPGLVDSITERAARYPFLAGYGFDA